MAFPAMWLSTSQGPSVRALETAQGTRSHSFSWRDNLRGLANLFDSEMSVAQESMSSSLPMLPL